MMNTVLLLYLLLYLVYCIINKLDENTVLMSFWELF